MKSKLLGVVILLSNFCFAQNGQFIDEIKLYTNYSFTENWTQSSPLIGDSIYFQIHEKEKRMFYLSPAIVFGAQNGHSHEIEISRLNYSNRQQNESYIQSGVNYSELESLGKQNVETFELQLRYEIKIALFKSKEWKIKPKLGFSASPYVSYTQITYDSNTNFDQTYSQEGIEFSLIPRLEYNINEKWYFDLNFPISGHNIQYTSHSVENPSLSSAERLVKDLSTTSKWAPNIRLGIAFKI